MPYIYSTLSQDNKYTFYKKIDVNGIDKGRLQEVEKEILIKGGTGVIDSRGQTAQFTEIKVTDEELAFLETHEVFKMHREKHFIVVTDKKIGDDNKITANMQKNDLSSQLTPSEAENGSERIRNPKPKTEK